MLPDRQRDIMRVQAKNLVLKLLAERKLMKQEGREDAATRKTRVPGTTETEATDGPSEETPGTA